ncbi:MAG: hypothetical protein KatS3mg094_361 [Candidatus Parcubacteria bacterium]|nr:MAG: hypothetical protein KatS3mg094_361 [Candidatus Parcubacteria bacterium]
MIDQIIKSIFILVSTVIGLGIFVLPYTALKSGIFFYFWLIIIPILVLIFHLVYGEIIFQVEEKHNLPSLVARIINSKLKLPIWLIDFLGLMMVFVVYLVVIEEIINHSLNLSFYFKPLLALFIFFILSFKNNFFSKLDSLLAIFLIVFILVLSGYLLTKVNIKNLLPFDANFVFSYGIILFSFTGYHSLQIIYDLLGKDKFNFIRVNILSLFFVFLIYLLYTLTVLGTIGPEIDVLSLFSLIKYLNINYLNYLILILFLLSILTTFISLAYYLKRGLIVDFRFKENISWLTIGLSIILISFFDFSNVMKLINFIGSLFIGLNLILILFCYLKLKEIKYFNIPKIIVYIMIVIFSLGWLMGLITE